MSAKFDRMIKELAAAIKEANRKKTSGYDTVAKVKRIEGNIAWVHIPGGVDETPVKRTINASPGDEVQVHVGDGKAWITGNATSPPTDDTTAKTINKTLVKAITAVKKTTETIGNIAGNTAQYFWHTETGNDTGVHITEIPKDDFLGDPASAGGNLLLRSTGIAIRKGLEELAQFGSTRARIGKKDEFHSDFTANGYRLALGNDELFSIKSDGEQTWIYAGGSTKAANMSYSNGEVIELADYLNDGCTVTLAGSAYHIFDSTGSDTGYIVSGPYTPDGNYGTYGDVYNSDNEKVQSGNFYSLRYYYEGDGFHVAGKFYKNLSISALAEDTQSPVTLLMGGTTIYIADRKMRISSCEELQIGMGEGCDVYIDGDLTVYGNISHS